MSLFLPGTASLVESIDRRVTVVLRDGRNLVGKYADTAARCRHALYRLYRDML